MILSVTRRRRQYAHERARARARSRWSVGRAIWAGFLALAGLAGLMGWVVAAALLLGAV